MMVDKQWKLKLMMLSQIGIDATSNRHVTAVGSRINGGHWKINHFRLGVHIVDGIKMIRLVCRQQ